jgi:hypothetical protein
MELATASDGMTRTKNFPISNAAGGKAVARGGRIWNKIQEDKFISGDLLQVMRV